jgi:hypothetical protein
VEERFSKRDATLLETGKTIQTIVKTVFFICWFRVPIHETLDNCRPAGNFFLPGKPFNSIHLLGSASGVVTQIA